MMAVETCENCGRAIGRLEQPFVWQKHVVCAECHGHLSAQSVAAAIRPPAPAVVPPPPLPPHRHFQPRVPPPAQRPVPPRMAVAAPQVERRPFPIVPVVAAGVIVLVGIAVGTYALVRSKQSAAVVTVTQPKPGVATAPAPVRPEPAPRTQPVEKSADDDDAQPTVASALFPPAESNKPAPSKPADAPPAAETVSLAPAESPVAVEAPKRSALPPAAPAPPSTAPAVPAEGTLERLVYDGLALLAQGRYQQALDQFNQAIKKDRNNADAWHGSGLCMQNMGNRDGALERLEKAVTLYDPPSRAAVYNCAVANLRENPMRAAKHVKDYLSAAGAAATPDEQMHTLMGRALFGVNRQARQNKFYAECQEFFFAYNEQLNATRHDGRKRWGGEWVIGGEATEKWNRYRTRQQNVENLRTSVDRATKGKKDAWDKLYDQRTGMRLISDKEQRMAQERWKQAAQQEIAVRKQLQAAETEFNSTEKPPFPQVVKLIPMDPPVPPSPGTLAK